MENEMETRLLVESEVGEEISLRERIWEENKLIWRTAFPGILFRLSMFSVFVVTQSFIGRIDQVELAAYALVQTVLFRFVNGILLGMSSATETLCGQAFGSKQYHMMGIYLQRSWIVNFVTGTLTLPLFIFASPIFKLLGQEDDLADASEDISLWFIGFLYAIVLSFTTEMYLQAQRKNMLIGILSPLSLLLHLLLSWIFVSKLNWGIPGAMGALVLSRWSITIQMLIYIFGGWCPNTWQGFSRDAFRDLIPVVKLSISSGVMQCVQLWYSSILVLLAGYTSNAAVNIAAFSISINISTWQLMFCLGFLGATCVRVSNEIGKGNATAAKFSVKLILTISVTLGFIISILCLIFGHDIPYLFTSSEEVATVAGDLSVPLAINMLLTSVQTVFSGVAVGTGSQGKVAIVNICSYYLVGVPIGCVLAYVADYGIIGIFIGLVSGQILQALVLGYMTWRIDWIAEVAKSRDRLNRFNLGRGREGDQTSNNES